MVFAALFCTSVPATAATVTTLDFEDLPPVLGGLPSTYKGFSWAFPMFFNSAGPGGLYPFAVHSGHEAIMSDGSGAISISSSLAFDLVTAWITPLQGSAGDSKEFTTTAYQGGTVVDSLTLSMPVWQTTLLTFNFHNVDSVVFSIPGASNREFAVDDISFAPPDPVSATPEPGSWALLSIGLASLANFAAFGRRAAIRSVKRV